MYQYFPPHPLTPSPTWGEGGYDSLTHQLPDTQHNIAVLGWMRYTLTSLVNLSPPLPNPPLRGEGK